MDKKSLFRRAFSVSLLAIPQWLSALAIPPLAYYIFNLIRLRSGWGSAARVCGRHFSEPALWLYFFIPASILIAVSGYRFPKCQSVINWLSLLGLIGVWSYLKPGLNL